MTSTPDTSLAPDIQVLVADHPQYVEALTQNRRWNFTINLIDMGAYSVTTATLSETTVVPYFVSQMTPNALIVGILPAIGWVGLYLPQIIGAYLIHSSPYRKRYIVRLVWLERMMIGLMFLVALGLGRISVEILLPVFLAMYFAFWAITGVLIPSYSDFYAKHIPTARGRFYGVQTLVAGCMGLLGAMLVRWRLAVSPFPLNFQSVLGIALLASFPALLAIHNMREVPFPSPPEPQPLGRYLRDIPALLRGHPAFARFVGVLSVMALGKMMVPFLAVYAVERFGLPGNTIAVYSGIMLLAQSLSALLWGTVGDRAGYHWIWMACGVLIFGQTALAWWAPAPGWFYVVFILVGATLGLEFTARPNAVYSLSPAAETPRFVGLANTLIAPWLAVGPLVSGALIDRFSYAAALGVGTAVAATGMLAGAAWLASQLRNTPTGS